MRAAEMMQVVRGTARDHALDGLIPLMVLLAGLPQLAAGAVAEQEKGVGTVWRECTDAAFASYNSCLMESSNWLHRKVCDLAFELDVVACSAKAAGAIRNAWNGVM